VPGRWPQRPFRPCTQTCIYFFERPVKPGEGLFQPGGPLAGLREIAMPELPRARNRTRAHWSVFMRPFRPNHLRVGIDPQRKSHK